MGTADDDELQLLRERAYGPGADESLDAADLDRLRELERGGSEREPAAQVTGSESVATSVEQVIAEQECGEFGAESRLAAPRMLRRSTVLLLLAVVVGATCVAIASIVVQREQPMPLDPAANQVARLSLDPSYAIPAFVAGPNPDPNSGSAGFQDFHGLRSVVTPVVFFGGSSGEACLVVYSATSIDDAKVKPFSGFISGACAAGNFPATVQFTLKTDGLPADLTALFPAATALQFVYDRSNKEIIVFVDD